MVAVIAFASCVLQCLTLVLLPRHAGVCRRLGRAWGVLLAAACLWACQGRRQR
jgi:hypothetical protein